ncbi:cilia- and flagella-associated protein HOATZ isoform X2 [Alligator mississippiensis]|uniref:cilia- and flagella-associated protein HOATZ isoform X2 n=1 Tax=Alligator mississippiensis TaxID=8496 RepID=UPI0009076ECC|nr:cilia- and flagella-associated protein HOATZ isoform X2 [Alligator mississippiensis]
MGLELIVGINESNSTQRSLVTSLAAKSYRTDQNAKRGRKAVAPAPRYELEQIPLEAQKAQKAEEKEKYLQKQPQNGNPVWMWLLSVVSAQNRACPHTQQISKDRPREEMKY